ILKSQLGAHYVSESHQKCLLLVIRSLLQLIQPHLNSGSQITINSELFELPSLLTNTDSTVLTTAINDGYAQLQQCYEALTTLTGGIQTLSDDSVRLSVESLRHQNLLQVCQSEVNQVKQSIVEQNSYIAGIAPNEAILQQELSSITQKAEDLQSIAYDGILT
ncbi:unnamed protein product, partial [Didymodactylos carnosus]